MSKIYTSADQLIGKTPLLELVHIEKELNLEAKILAKLPERNFVKPPFGVPWYMTRRFPCSSRTLELRK